MMPKLFFKVLLLLFVLEHTLGQTPPAPLVVESAYDTSFTELQGGKEGTKIPFSQGTTVPGFWSNDQEYIVSDGTSNQGGLYSFGTTGSAVRAMGTVTSNSKKTVIFGVSMTSNVSISSFAFNIEAAQFRYGGDNATSLLNFDYLISTLQEYQSGAWGVSGNTAGWITVPSLSFTSLVNSTSGVPVGPVTNRVQKLTANVSVTLPAGMVIQFRFLARNARDGLGINSIQVVPTVMPNPPPNISTSSTVTLTSSTTAAATTDSTTTTTTTATTTTGSPLPPIRGRSEWTPTAIAGWTTAGGVLVLGSIMYVLWRKRRSRYVAIDGRDDRDDHDGRSDNSLAPAYAQQY